jgi:hypothetical protein
MRRHLTRSAFLVALAALVIAAPTASGEDTASAGTAQNGKYCSIHLEKASEGEVSPVAAKACSDVSIEQARAEMHRQYAAKRRADGDGVAASYVLMHWYQNVNYNRDQQGAYWEFSGDRCDTAGYRINPDAFWRANLSSIVGNYDCFVARVYNIALNSAADFNIHVDSDGRWLGAYSDNVGRIQLHA